MEIEFWWRQIFEILIIHEPSLGSLDVPQKIWARSVQPFWRLLDTNRQTPLCSPNINKQIVNIADENLSDYSFLSRYHYTKSKNYLKRRYRIRHWIPMFIGTPCIIPPWENHILLNKKTSSCSSFYLLLMTRTCHITLPKSLYFCNPKYFKLWIMLDQIILVWNIKGLHHQVVNIYEIQNLSSWQKLNSLIEIWLWILLD